MLCSRCNSTSPNGNRYCDACGAPLQSGCPFCGHSNRPGAQFCGGCGRALARDDAVAAAPETAAPATAPLLPAPLAALLRSRFAREGERKQVTVLFADIRGSTELIEELDPEQALHRLEPGLQTMVKAVHQYGGTVCRIHGDGIMALFGAPLAFEDHAVRACFAARAMIDGVARLGEDYVDIRVGLNSGEVVVRSIGHDLSMDYDAVGPTTHLASRMEHLAMPGTVCMTARTARMAAGFIQVRARGFETIKGISRPVEVFELVGAAGQTRWQVRAAAHSLSPFVGRQTELRILLEALQRARTGRGQIVAIAGEAGMGKSRLVHEFLQDPSIGEEFSLRSAAMPHDQNTPYQLVAGMVRSWLRVETDDSQAEIDEKLVGAMVSFHPDHSVDLTPLRSLLDLPVQDGAWERLDAVQRRRRMHEVVRSLVLRAALTTPFVLVIEDAHWADFESQSILESIIDGLGAAHLLIIVTYRPEYHHQWARHSYYSLVQLRALDGDSSDKLLGSLLGDATDLASLRQRMIKQTDGTPLFLEEMARTLVETGVLVSEPTRFRLTRSVEDIEIPDSVQNVLASRIDRLPSEERSLLQVASVIGKDIPVALLRAVADVPADQLARQLLELRSLEFLYEVNGSSGTEYTFKHALTHAVAYDGMLLRHRRALHGQVLTAIEENFSERIDEFTERLADHAVRGEVWDKAAAYCCKAGQRANGLSAHRAARTFFERALDAAGRLPMSRRVVQQAIEIRLGLRVSLVASADLELVRKYLQEAESLARSIDDERRLMPIVISRSTILNNLGDLPGAVEAGLHGRALAERMNDEASFISSGFALGQAYWNRGDFAKAEDILSATVQTLTADLRKRYAGTTGTASVLCLVSLSHTHCLVGNWQQAFARSREALEIAMETEKPYDLSYAHGAQGLAHLTVGEFEAAIRHLEEALRIAQAAEIMLLVPHAARYLGRAYALTGRLDEASTLLSGAVDQAKSQSLAALHGWCAAALGLTRLLSGASGEAERLVRGALDFARGQEYRPLEVHASRLLGVISTQASSDAAAATRAERWFRGAITLAAELGMQPEQAHCHDGLADLLARTGRLPEARGELAQALELYRASGMQSDAARIAVALAGVGGEVQLPAPATPTPAVGRRIA